MKRKSSFAKYFSSNMSQAAPSEFTAGDGDKLSIKGEERISMQPMPILKKPPAS